MSHGSKYHESVGLIKPSHNRAKRDEEDQREGALFTGKEEEEENDGPEQDAE